MIGGRKWYASITYLNDSIDRGQLMVDVPQVVRKELIAWLLSGMRMMALRIMVLPMVQA